MSLELFQPAHPVQEEAITLLVLLVSGHVGADFLVQTSEVAREKGNRGGALVKHGLLTFASHLFCLLPFWCPAVLAGAALVGGVHTAVDWAKVRVERRRGDPFTAFVVDQAVHCATLLGVFLILRGSLDNGWIDFPQAWLEPLRVSCLVVSGYIINGKGGATAVRRLLERYPHVGPSDGGDGRDIHAMGRTIGCLERFLVYTLVLLGEWGALGLVVAAKSIARFKELERQSFADYYLIGTLSSILVAIATGLVVKALI